MASRPGLGLDPRYPPRGRGMGWEATLRLRPGRVGGGRELLAVHPRLTLALGPGPPALRQHPQGPDPRPTPPPERLHPGPSSPTPALPAPPPWASSALSFGHLSIPFPFSSKKIKWERDREEVIGSEEPEQPFGSKEASQEYCGNGRVC